MEEGNYKAAIDTLKQVVYRPAGITGEKLVQAYLGLKDAYLGVNDYEQAAGILQRGYAVTGDEALNPDHVTEQGDCLINLLGKVVRKSIYDNAGTLIGYHSYSYNRRGRFCSVTSYNLHGKQTGHVNFRYGINPEQMERWYYYKSNSGIVMPIVYVYDVSGHLVKESRFDEAGRLQIYTLYNSAGKEQEYAAYEPDGGLRIRSVTDYDHIGEVASVKYYYADGSMDEERYIRDEEHRSLRLERYSKGSLWNYVVSEYDENGNMTAQTLYDPEGNVEYQQNMN